MKTLTLVASPALSSPAAVRPGRHARRGQLHHHGQRRARRGARTSAFAARRGDGPGDRRDGERVLRESPRPPQMQRRLGRRPRPYVGRGQGRPAVDERVDGMRRPRPGQRPREEQPRRVGERVRRRRRARSSSTTTSFISIISSRAARARRGRSRSSCRAGTRRSRCASPTPARRSSRSAERRSMRDASRSPIRAEPTARSGRTRRAACSRLRFRREASWRCETIRRADGRSLDVSDSQRSASRGAFCIAGPMKPLINVPRTTSQPSVQDPSPCALSLVRCSRSRLLFPPPLSLAIPVRRCARLVAAGRDLARAPQQPALPANASARQRAGAALRTSYGVLLPDVSTNFSNAYREGRPQFFGGQAFGRTSDVISSTRRSASDATYSGTNLHGAEGPAREPRRRRERPDERRRDAALAVTGQYLNVLRRRRARSCTTRCSRARRRSSTSRARAQRSAPRRRSMCVAPRCRSVRRVAVLRERNNVEIEKLRLFQQLGVEQPTRPPDDGAPGRRADV